MIINQREKNLINKFLKLNKLKLKIEYAKFARNMINNHNSIERQIMNNRMRALIRLTHPLEAEIFILSQNMSPANVERVKRLRRVVAVQRIAKKTIKKRHNNNARLRAAIRRTQQAGAYHSFRPLQIAYHAAATPAQLARFTRAKNVPKKAYTTRSTTVLSRHLTR